MKMLLSITLLSLAVFSQTVRADDDKSHPCHAIKAACEAAGFKKGAHKESGKGLWVDCVKPLNEGKTVAGVSVTPDQVAACKAKKAEHKAAKGK